MASVIFNTKMRVKYQVSLLRDDEEGTHRLRCETDFLRIAREQLNEMKFFHSLENETMRNAQGRYVGYVIRGDILNRKSLKAGRQR